MLSSLGKKSSYSIMDSIKKTLSELQEIKNALSGGMHALAANLSMLSNRIEELTAVIEGMETERPRDLETGLCSKQSSSNLYEEISQEDLETVIPATPESQYNS